MENEGFYVEVEVDSSKDKEVYYCFDSSLKKDDHVIVESDFALELATVVSDAKRESEAEKHSQKQIIRKASKEDIEIYLKNKKDAVEAIKVFNNNVNKLNLNMRLVSAVYSFDHNKILFTYVSEERVDFRELLKELSNVLKCRIELRQIGPRDRSKSIGGIGICGLPLCCKSFLNEFEGISINMAKNQFLALNIQKLSGQCNKLLCCLKYEDEQYSELKKNAPKYGFKFDYDGKSYKVSGINLLSKTLKIESLDKEIIKVISFDEFNEMNKR